MTFLTRLFAIVLSVALLWVVIGQEFRQDHLLRLEACEETYGTPLAEWANVRGSLKCTVMCLENPGCASSVYVTTTRVCRINSETWVNPPTTGCTLNVLYTYSQAVATPVCAPGASCTNPVNNVRLCDGGGTGVCDPAQGRIEVFHNSEWGTVCDDYWNDFHYSYYDSPYEYGASNANVLCRMLGYTDGTPRPMAAYGPGADAMNIMMDSIACHGNEASLFDCPFDGWGSHNCTHTQDVGVSCV